MTVSTHLQRITSLKIVCRESVAEEQGLLVKVVPLGWAQLPTAVGEQTSGAPQQTGTHRCSLGQRTQAAYICCYRTPQWILILTYVRGSLSTSKTSATFVSQFLRRERDSLPRGSSHFSSEYLQCLIISAKMYYSSISWLVCVMGTKILGEQTASIFRDDLCVTARCHRTDWSSGKTLESQSGGLRSPGHLLSWLICCGFPLFL
jgi:hypothetical protein